MARLVWITGYPGSGKTTLGKRVYQAIKDKHPGTVFIDGDIFREVMMNELGHSPADRLKNAHRIARLCRMLTKQQINVVCCTVSLFHEIHAFNRENNEHYLEVFLEVPQTDLMARDQKGLYSSQTLDIASPSSIFQPPLAPDLRVQNSNADSIENNVQQILNSIL